MSRKTAVTVGAACALSVAALALAGYTFVQGWLDQPVEGQAVDAPALAERPDVAGVPVAEGDLVLELASLDQGGNTEVLWRCGKTLLGTRHDYTGAFGALSGRALIDPRTRTPRAGEVHVAVGSLRGHGTNPAPGALVNTVRASRWFLEQEHPTAVLVIDSIAPLTEGGAAAPPGASHTLSGRLTINGIERPVAVPARVEVGEASLALDATFTVSRAEYGVEQRQGVAQPAEVDDAVEIEVRVRAAPDPGALLADLNARLVAQAAQVGALQAESQALAARLERLEGGLDEATRLARAAQGAAREATRLAGQDRPRDAAQAAGIAPRPAAADAAPVDAPEAAAVSAPETAQGSVPETVSDSVAGAAPDAAASPGAEAPAASASGALPARFTDRVDYANAAGDPRVRDLGGTVEFEMVLVPGDPGRGLAPFYAQTTEVTWDMFRAWSYCQDLVDVEYAAELKGALLRPSPCYDDASRGFGFDGRAVLGCSRRNAVAFCKHLSEQTGRSYRLWTDEEWRHVVALTGGPPADLRAVGWFADNAETDEWGDPRPMKVGTKPADALGLHDLWGNVAEWVMADKQFVRGGSYLVESGEVSLDWRADESQDVWNMTYPNTPKSLWWYRDRFDMGFRLVCDPVNLPEGE